MKNKERHNGNRIYIKSSCVYVVVRKYMQGITITYNHNLWCFSILFFDWSYIRIYPLLGYSLFYLDCFSVGNKIKGSSVYEKI